MARRISGMQMADMATFSRALRRHNQESLRRAGKMRQVVLGLLDKGQQPSNDDLADALLEPPPNPEKYASVPLTPAEQADLMRDPPTDHRAWAKAHISKARRNKAIAAARSRIDADSRRILEYAVKHYVRGVALAPGPKKRERPWREEEAIRRAYFEEHERLRAAHETDSRQPRAFSTLAKRAVAKQFGIETRTIEKIVKGYRAKFS